MKVPYTFSVLRYIHDPVTMEFAGWDFVPLASEAGGERYEAGADEDLRFAWFDLAEAAPLAVRRPAGVGVERA